MIEPYRPQLNDKVFVAGSSGLVGSTIVESLKARGFDNIITSTSKNLDLTDAHKVSSFLGDHKVQIVIDAAAKVGGIWANMNYPADFIYLNTQIQNNLIHHSYLQGVKKFVFLATSCIYPRESAQPIKEEYLLTGPLESTNHAYAVAKIAGIEMIRSYREQYGVDYITLNPTNLFGPNDNFSLKTGHAVPAMIHRMHDAKEKKLGHIEIWGSGKACREFMYCPDAAEAIVFLMENYSENEMINVGTGIDHSIKEIAQTVQTIVGFKGELRFDTSKPEGMPRKLLDCGKLHQQGWKAPHSLKEGVEKAYKWFLENQDQVNDKIKRHDNG